MARYKEARCLVFFDRDFYWHVRMYNYACMYACISMYNASQLLLWPARWRCNQCWRALAAAPICIIARKVCLKQWSVDWDAHIYLYKHVHIPICTYICTHMHLTYFLCCVLVQLLVCCCCSPFIFTFACCAPAKCAVYCNNFRLCSLLLRRFAVVIELFIACDIFFYFIIFFYYKT